jgi:hypothetical protein
VQKGLECVQLYEPQEGVVSDTASHRDVIFCFSTPDLYPCIPLSHGVPSTDLVSAVFKPSRVHCNKDKPVGDMTTRCSAWVHLGNINYMTRVHDIMYSWYQLHYKG